MHSLAKYSLAWVLLGTIPSFAAGPDSSSTAPAAPDSAVSNPDSSDIRQLLSQMRELIRAQSQQLEQQRRALEEQKQELDAVKAQVQSGHDEEASSVTPAAALNVAVRGLAATRGATYSGDAEPVESANFVRIQSPTPETANAPLSLKLGNATFTPGGWVDFTSIYRTTDVGSGLGTSFQSIPYNNTVPGGLSENRLTAASSRLSLKVDENIGHDKIYGYVEADFNGALPSNAFVSSNSDSFRLRVYYLNLTHHNWDVLGGQSWSLLTPNRKGLSPFLSEIYNTVHLDTNYNVGLTFARQTQLRAVYHFNPGLAFGLSVENPEQFSGSAATFPSLFSNSETDINSGSGAGGNTATPNLHPDVIAKLAGDKVLGLRNFHVEAAGLLTSVQVFTPASVTKGSTATDSREGGGVAVNANLEIIPNFHLITDTYWSDGGGRYIGGLGPGFVVAQQGSATAPFSAQLVHSGSGIGGFEWKVNKSTLISALYGGAYFQRVSSFDPSSKTPLLVGYGFTGSANSNNRAIQEGSFGTVTTLWKNEQLGSLQIVTQSSYVTRAPWFVAPDSPKDAHVFMEYGNIRYVLP